MNPIDYAGTFRFLPATLGGLLFLLALGGYWIVLNKSTKFDDVRELFHKGNRAFAVQRLSLMLAFGIASSATLIRDADYAPWWGLLYQLVEQTWVFFAMLVVRLVVDYVVLKWTPNVEAIEAGNMAVAVIEAGFYLGFGFILRASLTGEAPSEAVAIVGTLLFAGLGLLGTLAFYWLHVRVLTWSVQRYQRRHDASIPPKWDFVRELQNGNVTVALEAAGALAALGIVMSAGVQGDFEGWLNGVIAFLVTILVAVALTYASRLVIDLLVLRGCTVSSIIVDKRPAAAATLATFMVVVAFATYSVVVYQM